jgi:hypothetical protein
MKWSQDVGEQVIAALNKRGAPRSCALCQKTDTWFVEKGFVTLILQEDPINIQMFGMGKGLPCVALTCGNCGNTALINLPELGVGGLPKE